jgi:hypothetical protein
MPGSSPSLMTRVWAGIGCLFWLAFANIGRGMLSSARVIRPSGRILLRQVEPGAACPLHRLPAHLDAQPGRALTSMCQSAQRTDLPTHPHQPGDADDPAATNSCRPCSYAPDTSISANRSPGAPLNPLRDQRHRCMIAWHRISPCRAFIQLP